MSPSITLPTPPSYYSLLSIPPPPSPPPSSSNLRRAYHRALLKHHPDKLRPSSQSCSSQSGGCCGSSCSSASTSRPAEVSVDLLTAAYKTLSDSRARREYDSRLQSGETGDAVEEARAAGVVVSWDLDEMEVEAGEDEAEDDGEKWRKRCRCGEMVEVLGEMLEEAESWGGREVAVPCSGCSLVYVVGFEVVEE